MLQVFSSIVRQETAFFDKNKTGELINRLSADSQLVSQTVTQQVRQLIRLSAEKSAGLPDSETAGKAADQPALS
jgi:ATP-binding cassette, subfamily B (MDR/TAP), member 10